MRCHEERVAINSYGKLAYRRKQKVHTYKGATAKAPVGFIALNNEDFSIALEKEEKEILYEYGQEPNLQGEAQRVAERKTKQEEAEKQRTEEAEKAAKAKAEEADKKREDLVAKLAEINPNDVDYINCHATATPTGDPVEAQAIWSLFFANYPAFAPAKKPLMNSSKGPLGHPLGAAGALELIITIESMKDSVIHPMGDYDLDPLCRHPEPPSPTTTCWNSASKELLIVQKRTEVNIDVAMSNNFGFGGHNCSIIVAKPDWK